MYFLFVAVAVAVVVVIAAGLRHARAVVASHPDQSQAASGPLTHANSENAGSFAGSRGVVAQPTLAPNAPLHSAAPQRDEPADDKYRANAVRPTLLSIDAPSEALLPPRGAAEPTPSARTLVVHPTDSAVLRTRDLSERGWSDEMIKKLARPVGEAGSVQSAGGYWNSATLYRVAVIEEIEASEEFARMSGGEATYQEWARGPKGRLRKGRREVAIDLAYRAYAEGRSPQAQARLEVAQGGSRDLLHAGRLWTELDWASPDVEAVRQYKRGRDEAEQRRRSKAKFDIVDPPPFKRGTEWQGG